MSQVTEALVEIAESLAVLRPELEGLQDFESLDLQAETHNHVQEAIRYYQERERFLEAAQAALTALVNDGHPDLPMRLVPADVLADLQEQTRTLAAAIAKFTAEQAARLQMAAGSPRPKA